MQINTPIIVTISPIWADIFTAQDKAGNWRIVKVPVEGKATVSPYWMPQDTALRSVSVLRDHHKLPALDREMMIRPMPPELEKECTP